MKNWTLAVLSLTVLSFKLNAQSVGIGNTNPNPNALLEIGVPSGEQGVLLPRLEAGTITSLSGTYGTNEQGMLVYDTDNDIVQTWDGTQWNTLGAGGSGLFSKTGIIISNAPANGGDYTTDNFVVGSPTLDYDGDINHSDRMFFNKPKAAFRVGTDYWGAWDDANLGFYSIGMGFRATAPSESAIALGEGTNAVAYRSVALGTYNLGIGTATSADPSSPILIIGNGTSNSLRSNAVTVLQNGNTGFNNQNTPATTVHINGAVTYNPFDIELNNDYTLKPENNTFIRLHPGLDLELTLDAGLAPGQLLIIENMRNSLILIKDIPGVQNLGPRHPDNASLPAGGIILDMFDTATFIFDGQQWSLLSSSANSFD